MAVVGAAFAPWVSLTLLSMWSAAGAHAKLVKIRAKVVRHGRYVTFQLAEVAVPRQLFGTILSLIARVRAPPTPA